MTTQVFRGKTLMDARQQAMAVLGKGAVILTTREVKRAGIGGWFGGTDVEVAAAVPGMVLDAPAPSRPFASSAYLSQPGLRSTAPDSRESLAALRAELRGEMRNMKLTLARNVTPSAPAADLAGELASIREMLDALAPQDTTSKLGKLLATRGIEGKAAAAFSKCMTEEGEERETLQARFARALDALVPVTSWPLASKARMVIAVVGPAGVGKTTTIAKLATVARMEDRTVTLVTCDTYRVGGVEQVKRYAELLGVRHEVARDAKALTGIIASATTDIVFVDTSGRPPRSDAPEASLSGAFAGDRERHVLLCLSASTRWVDAVAAMKAFGSTKPTAVAITKLDETEAPAGLVHGAVATKLPLSVLCTGQRVPEDIEPATPAAVRDRCRATERAASRSKENGK